MKRRLSIVFVVLLATSGWLHAQSELARKLQPFVDCINGNNTTFALKIDGEISIRGGTQTVKVELSRRGDDSLTLLAEHPDYALRLQRDALVTKLYLPRHHTMIVGEGQDAGADTLAPAGLLWRLVSADSLIAPYIAILSNNAAALDVTLGALPGLEPQGDNAWMIGESHPIHISFPDERTLELSSDDNRLKIQLCEPEQLDSQEMPSATQQSVDRAELERLIVRGVRRATEIVAPNGKLLSPPRTVKQTAGGRLTWVQDQRVAILSGTPRQIGQAHGELLGEQARRCMDSVLYSIGIAKTIESGRWFLNDLRDAWKRLEPHIPQDHKTEMIAMAEAIGVSAEEAQLANIFPELFHCSGFAVWGSATAGGKLYHGRVLDYMTMVGLQDAATTFIVSPDGKHSFANVGYAGFIGSVSGMNDQQISLGEMGGRGEGNWDGVPMATLMRRALEECSTLDQVRTLWSDSPRTCEYYYVFADGKIPGAVGVAATPEKIEFIEPGQTHDLLGEGIKDAVVLSAGERLKTLRQRVNENLGTIDAERAMGLMCRPVAMKSNLHNVLFVPQDGVFYVANASHKLPGAERDYVRYDLKALLSDSYLSALPASE